MLEIDFINNDRNTTIFQKATIILEFRESKSKILFTKLSIKGTKIVTGIFCQVCQGKICQVFKFRNYFSALK